MPNLTYMLVNFVYLAGIAVWVGAALAGLLIFQGDMRHAPGAGRSLARLIQMQTLCDYRKLHRVLPRYRGHIRKG